MIKKNDKTIMPIMVFSNDYNEGGLTLNLAVVVTEENAEELCKQINDVFYDGDTDLIEGAIEAWIEEFVGNNVDEWCKGKRGIHIRQYVHGDCETGWFDTFIPFGDMVIERRGYYVYRGFEDTAPYVPRYETISLDTYDEYVRCGDYISAKMLLDDIKQCVMSIYDDVIM